MDGSMLPIFLRLRDCPCLLVGGEGETTTHGKGLALLRAGARLTIVAPVLDTALREAVERGGAVWKPEPFQDGDLDGMWLAVSVSEDEDVNSRLFAGAVRRRIWLNVVDQPRFCTFYWPAVVERPPVVVAIATGGAAPALAGFLGRRLAAWLPERIGALAGRLAEWRAEVPGGVAARGRFWRELLDGGVADRFLSGDEEGATAGVRAALEAVNRREKGG